MAEAGYVEGGAADASANRSRARRVVHIVLAVLVAFVVPVLLLDALVGQYGANAMVLGVLVGALGSKIGGTRRMVYLAPAIGLAAGLGAFTAYDWWWVGLLAAAGVVAGAGIGFGWMLPLLMIPFVATFASPVSSGQHAVAYGVIAAVATGYGIVLARRFGAAAVVEGQRVRAAVATAVALVFGAILGGAAAIGVALAWTEPYWVPEPILILALYILIGRRDRIGGKAIGTAVGAAAAIPIAIIAPPTWAIALIAAAAFVLAVMQTKTYRTRSGPRTSRPGRLGGGAAWCPNPYRCRPSRGRSGHHRRCGQVAGQALPPTRTRPCALRNVGLTTHSGAHSCNRGPRQPPNVSRAATPTRLRNSGRVRKCWTSARAVGSTCCRRLVESESRVRLWRRHGR
jgi:MFS family permease